MTPLDRITARVNRDGPVDDQDTPIPLLTLEEYFDGNNVIGSIGCNLTPTPTPMAFYKILKEIAQRNDVADVRVQITMFDDPDWPFSDTIWVVTSADPESITESFPDNMKPDETWCGWSKGRAYASCSVAPGMKPVALWWD